MKELLVARRGLVKDRVAATNRDHVCRAPLLERLTDQRLRQIAAIDATLLALCRADAELKARLDILVSLPAIGEATALTMLIEMLELGTIEDQIPGPIDVGKSPDVAITAIMRKLAILANALLREHRIRTQKPA